MAPDLSKSWASSLVNEYKDREYSPEDKYDDIELEELRTLQPTCRNSARPPHTKTTEVRARDVVARLNPQLWNSNSHPPILRREATGLDGTYFHRPAGQSSILSTVHKEEDNQYLVNHCSVKPPACQSRWRDHGTEIHGENDEDDEGDVDEDLGFVLDNIHGIESESGRLDVLAAMAQERRFVLPVVMVCLGISQVDEQVQQRGIASAARFIADPDMEDSFGDFITALDQLDPTVAAKVKHRVCQIRISQHQEQIGRDVPSTNQLRPLRVFDLRRICMRLSPQLAMLW